MSSLLNSDPIDDLLSLSDELLDLLRKEVHYEGETRPRRSSRAVHWRSD